MIDCIIDISAGAWLGVSYVRVKECDSYMQKPLPTEKFMLIDSQKKSYYWCSSE